MPKQVCNYRVAAAAFSKLINITSKNCTFWKYANTFFMISKEERRLQRQAIFEVFDWDRSIEDWKIGKVYVFITMNVLYLLYLLSMFWLLQRWTMIGLLRICLIANEQLYLINNIDRQDTHGIHPLQGSCWSILIKTALGHSWKYESHWVSTIFWILLHNCGYLETIGTELSTFSRVKLNIHLRI